MDRATATLVAALVAAAGSIISLFVKRASTMRKAHRDSLEPHIGELAKSIHQAVATSAIIVKTNSTQSRERWRARGTDTKKTLKALRTELRYSLWGLDKAIRELALLPDWVEHAWDYPEYRKELIERGDKLSDALDRSIRRCYAKGRTPSWFERAYVECRRRHLKSSYNELQDVKAQDWEAKHST